MRPIDTGKHARPEIIDPGPAPMLQWLKIAQLVIDDSYQRPLAKQNRKAIAAIAAQFRWSRFSPVFAAPIEGGLFAVIDGQHRTHAAALCGFSEVPCQIVQMSLQEQAESFSAVNGLVTKVTTGQLFKAALAAGEERAVRMDAIARAGGCRLMTVNASAETKKPGEIFALKAYGQCVDQFKENRLIATLQALMAAEGYCDTPEIWAGQILFPIIRAFARIHRDMAVDEIVDWLEQYPIWDAIDSIDEDGRYRIRHGLPRKTKRAALEQRLFNALEKSTTTEVAA